MKSLLLTTFLCVLVIPYAVCQDKFSLLDSTQNAVQNEIQFTGLLMHEKINIENVEAISDSDMMVTFKIDKEKQSLYSWIKCIFRNNRCVSTEYVNPISSLGSIFYFLAQDFNFSSDAKLLTHKNLNIKGEISYDFTQQYYSIKYTRINSNHTASLNKHKP